LDIPSTKRPFTQAISKDTPRIVEQKQRKIGGRGGEKHNL